MRSSVERLEIIRCDWRRDVGVASCCRFLESLLVVDVACLVVVGEGVAGGGAPVSSCVSVLVYVLVAALAAPQTALLLVGHRGRVCKRVEEGCVGQALSFYTPCLPALADLAYFGDWPQNNSTRWRLPAGSSTGSEAHGKPKSYPAEQNIWTSPTHSRENSKIILRWQDYNREAHGKIIAMSERTDGELTITLSV